MTNAASPDLSILLPSLAGGGAERAMLNLAGELVRRGRRVTLLLFAATGALAEQVPEGVSVEVLGARRAATAALPLARWIDRRRPRVLLSVMLHTNMAASVGVKLARYRPRFVWSLQNLPGAVIAAMGPVKAAVLRAGLGRAVRVPDAIGAVSDGVARAFLELRPEVAEKIVRLYNPVVDAARIRPRRTRAEGEPPRLIAVGRLAPQKDYPLMLRAFARLRRDPAGNQAELMILGEGPLRAELEAMAATLGIADAVQMPGFVGDTGVWLDRSDIFVMSSAFEGLANVIPEAMAAGLPVVTTDWPPAAREVLGDGRWGRLVPLDDADALARALLDTIADGGIDARERARDFEIGHCTDAYEAVLFPDD